MAFNIDYNRGVMMTRHPSGIEVFMYLEEPGKYLSAHGTPVSEKLAKEAGMDTEKFRKQRIVTEKMAEHRQKVLAELEIAQQDRVVVAEQGGFSVVDLGQDRHQVLDPDGTVLTAEPLPKEAALGLLDQLAPLVEIEAEKSEKKLSIRKASAGEK